MPFSIIKFVRLQALYILDERGANLINYVAKYFSTTGRVEFGYRV